MVLRLAENTAQGVEVIFGFHTRKREKQRHHNTDLETRDQSILQRQGVPPTHNGRNTLVKATVEHGGEAESTGDTTASLLPCTVLFEQSRLPVSGMITTE